MATTRISGAARELKLMETERLALLRKVSDRKVTATFDGVIAALDVAVGDSLEAKDNVGTLVNTDYLTAEVEVAETDVPKLVVGQPVDFTFSVYNQGAGEAEVTSRRRAPLRGFHLRHREEAVPVYALHHKYASA